MERKLIPSQIDILFLVFLKNRDQRSYYLFIKELFLFPARCFFSLFEKMKMSGGKLMVKELLLWRPVNYCCLRSPTAKSIKGPFLLFIFGKIS